jgi:hypothetical protein
MLEECAGGWMVLFQGLPGMLCMLFRTTRKTLRRDVDLRGDVWMLRPKNFLPPRQRLSVHRLHLFVLLHKVVTEYG